MEGREWIARAKSRSREISVKLLQSIQEHRLSGLCDWGLIFKIRGSHRFHSRVLHRDVTQYTAGQYSISVSISYFSVRLIIFTSCCCSVAKPCLTLCNPMDCSTPGFPVLHYLPEFAQVHIHWVSDTIWPSHSLPPTSPLAFSLSQHQGLFQWVSSLPQVAKVLELQLQHHFLQWIFRIDFL